MLIYMIFTHIYQRLGMTDDIEYQELQYALGFFMPWFFYKGGIFAKTLNIKSLHRGGTATKAIFSMERYINISRIYFKVVKL